LKNPIGMEELLTFFRDTLLTERTTDINSVIHRLDPRVKLISLISIIVCAVILENVIFSGILFLILTILVLLSRIPLKLYVVRTSIIPIFSLLIALPLPFIVMGTPLAFIHVYGFTYLTVSFEGLYRALVFVSRVWIAAGSAVLLISTTKFSSLAMALRKLGAPELFTTLLLITYRYIFLFADEALSMIQARNLRSYGKESLLKKIKTVGQMIGTLFIRAFERGESVYYAMLSRGYIGKLESYRQQKIRKRDVAFLFLVLALVSGLIVMNFLGFRFTVLNYSYFTYLVMDSVIKKVYIITDITRKFWGVLIV
jgi:cobalt/nickel transport system permease protein